MLTIPHTGRLIIPCLNDSHLSSLLSIFTPLGPLLIKLGDPVSGALAETDSKHGASHLNARIPVSYMERYDAAPRGFEGRGLSLTRDAISQLPALGPGNSPRSNGAHSKLLTQPCHLHDIAIRTRDRSI